MRYQRLSWGVCRRDRPGHCETVERLRGLTVGRLAPIMRPSFGICPKGDVYVVYVSTAVEPQKEARTRIPQAHEHKERPEGLGPPPSQGPRAFDGLGLLSTPHGVHPPCLPQAGTSFSEPDGERSSRARSAESSGGVQTMAPTNQPDHVTKRRRSSPFSSREPRHRICKTAWPSTVHRLLQPAGVQDRRRHKPRRHHCRETVRDCRSSQSSQTCVPRADETDSKRTHLQPCIARISEAGRPHTSVQRTERRVAGDATASRVAQWP
jgi:hypothetical protein